MQIRYRQNRCKILRIAACHFKKKMGTQIVITHVISASDLPPIEKNFYIEDPDVANMDLDEVEDLR